MKSKLPLQLFVICLLFNFNITAQTTSNLNPSADNSIYSENNNSNGQGDLFCGFTRFGDIRRALLKFDLSIIPNGATINSVTLSLNVNKVAPAAGIQTHTLHALTKNWGEGSSSASGPGGTGTTSVAPDATWSDAMLGTSTWSSAGGDFNVSSVSSVDMNSLGNYTFPSSTDFASLVQSWLDNSSSNFGVILIGQESGDRNARRFNSKESASNQPVLSVTWTNNLSVEDFALKGFSIVPNPSHSSIKLDLPNSIKEVQIVIHDVLGKAIYQSNYTSNSIINISNFKSGVYLVRASSLGITKTKRLLKL